MPARKPNTVMSPFLMKPTQRWGPKKEEHTKTQNKMDYEDIVVFWEKEGIVEK